MASKQSCAFSVAKWVLLVFVSSLCQLSVAKDSDWVRSQEKDELVEKVSTFLYFRREGIVNNPRAIIEIRSTCEAYSDKSGIYSFDVISLYNTPNMTVHHVAGTGFVPSVTYTKSRAIKRNGSLYTAILHQSAKYGNVFEHKQILQQGSQSTGYEIKKTDLNDLAKKIELEFADGSKFIIEFNKSYWDFHEKCRDDLQL